MPDVENADAQSPEKKGAGKITLSFSVPSDPFQRDQIPEIYAKLREAAGIADSPSAFAEVCRNSGTHILKLLNPKAEDHILRFPIAGSNQAPKFFPSMNARFGKFAKILYQPVAIEGTEEARSLLEHVMQPDGLSPEIEASFVAAFSKESLEAICEKLKEERTGVATLPAQNFPIVYAPDPDGGELQLTPISPMQSYNGFKAEVIPKKGVKEPIRLMRQDVSSKMQNISVAIGGPRVRFYGSVPPAMMRDEAALLRMIKGGPVPAPSSYELSDRLDHLVKLHAARAEHANGKGYFNAEMEHGMRRLISWIIDEAITWLDETLEAAREMEPDFEMPQTDIGLLLLNGYRREKVAREMLRAALGDQTFRKILKQKVT